MCRGISTTAYSGDLYAPAMSRGVSPPAYSGTERFGINPVARAPHRVTGLQCLHCWRGPKKCGYTSFCKTLGVNWLLKNELAAEITCHTKRKTGRVKACHHELISGSTRRAAGRNPAARSRIDARRHRGVRPDELAARRAQHRVKRSH
jgi:hypothetical protein